MFWIHGGGHVQGGAPLANAGLRVYDGRRLAGKTGNVVVTINYRLGPLGWLAHPGLTNESGAAGSGNYGTLDQIAALEWVRRNIEAFGGDPGRVMIFGESAGGVSVCSLIASRLAAGLFHRAVIQSGGCNAKPLKEAGEFGMELAVKAGCGGAEDTAACLRGLELERLMRARPVEIDVAGRPSEYGSVVDGFVLTDTPSGVIAAGEHNRVPVIVGSSSDETSRSVPLIRNETEYVAAVRLLFPARTVAGEVLAMYPARDYASPRAAYVALTSDAKFICGARAAARALDENQAEPVWRYVMTHAPENTPPAFRALGAWHGLDAITGTSTGATTPSSKSPPRSIAGWATARGNATSGTRCCASRPDQRAAVTGAKPCSASSLMKTPPTTERAWKPRCLPSSVQYQSVIGTRDGDSSRNRNTGSTSASKSARDPASVAVQTIQSSLV
jgi:para-nitrobenzyl esterase